LDAHILEENSILLKRMEEAKHGIIREYGGDDDYYYYYYCKELGVV
jgi:hypothetical protein